MFLASATDIGRVREENQDSVSSFFLGDNVSVTVVCDGMGGAASGGVASRISVESFVERIKLNYRPNMAPNSIRNMLLTAVHYSNTAVYEKSREDIDKNGMGTTLVAALVIEKNIYIVSVGDSRAYLLNDDGIKQITTDHTYAYMLYQQGEIPLENVKNHPMRNVITKAVGVEPDVEVDYFELEETGNFAVFLCSDGLTNYCSEELIYKTVFGNDLDKAVNDLIDFANQSGGKDNITAAVVAN